VRRALVADLRCQALFRHARAQAVARSRAPPRSCGPARENWQDVEIKIAWRVRWSADKAVIFTAGQ